MAWRMDFYYGNKKIWIHFSMLILLFILTRRLATASTCIRCISSECTEQEECHCKETRIFNVERRWNSWNGRYENHDGATLYSFATCKYFLQDTKLGPEICINNDCKYITFLQSNIGVLKVNSFVHISNIREIYLNRTGILQIHLGAFSGISKLQVLHLEENKISKISKGYLNSLISLKILDLHRNNISLIENESFFGLTMLEKLDLSHNLLEIIPTELFAPLENLKVLNLSHNHLTGISFDLSLSQTLNSLDLSSNRIEILDVCFNESKLHSFYLQENQISFLNGSCFPVSLTTLFVQRNNITELNNAVLEDLTELKELDVSQNDITEISVDLFKDCKNLRKLDLSHNNIDYIKTGVFSGVPHLTFLNISYTQLKALEPHTFIPLNHLKIFDFDNNDLSDIDASIFEHLTNLEEIYISGNHFSCSGVASIISQSKIKNFSVVYEKDYSTENVNGMSCKKKNVSDAVVHSKISDNHKKEKLFDRNWKMREEEIFENISKNLHNKIRDLMDAEEVSFNNSLDEFSNKQEHMLQQYKIIIESGKVDLKKFIMDLYSKNSGTIDKPNSVDAKLIHKKIEKHFDVQNTKLEDNFMKFSKDLRTFIEKSVPSIEYSAINSFRNVFNLSNPSTSMLKRDFVSDSENATTNNQIKNLSRKIDQLQMILVIICAFCIFLYVVGKVSVIYWKRFQTNKDSLDISQELPILRSY